MVMAGASSTIMNYIVHFLAIGLRFTQMCIDFESDGASETVFEHFMLMDRSVTCFKLFIDAYGQVHAEGVGMFVISSLVGLFLHLFTIVIHLYMKHRSRARAWISGMVILVTAGAFMLAMKIPEDHAWHWHKTAVEAILDFFVCLEAFLLVWGKMSEHGDGGNDNLLRDFLMILTETLITVYLFVDYLGKTHSPWDAQKILHLVGSCLSVLFGLGQIVWISYKAYTHWSFARGEEQPVGAAMHGDGGVDVEEQVVEEGVDVMVAVWAWLSAPTVFLQLVQWDRMNPRVFTMEVEMAAIENDGGGDEGEEVAPEEVFEVAVAFPA